MKKFVMSLLILAVLCSSLFAEESAYEIMKRARNLPEPETTSETATLTIHSKKGKDRIRQVIMKSRDYGEVEKEVIVFTAPKDVAGVGYLMFDYDEKEDGSKQDSDSWLYMPAMKKTRRIAGSGSDSDNSFMGTDFTYGDMENRSLSKDNYELLGSESIDGVSCFKVKCIGKDRSEKDPDRIAYIGKDDYVLRKCEYYDRQGSLHRVLTCSDIKVIDGFYIMGKMRMDNVQSGTYSFFEVSDVDLDGSKVDDSTFTVASLERGVIR